jgi:glyoxylase-like metal-dependent hydrolase (beta-lactamase superfamily II)
VKKVLTGLAAFLTLAAMQAPPAKPPAAVSLWRLDCGNFVINDYNAFFSDTMAYKPGPKKITSSCYLIRHGDRYLLWDTGLAEKLLGKPDVSPAQTMSLDTTIARQLAQLGVKPEQVEFVGISHYHMDHLGQAANFPKAALVIGAGDVEHIKSRPTDYKDELAALRPWLEGGSRLVAVSSDVDFFRDGRVIMLKTPGHTPGHSALLVKLASGNVLLTGDLYHFTEQVAMKGVPPFNFNRADTLASMDRFDKLAKNLNAKVIIQHEPADVAKLPKFPAAAR